MKWIKFLKAYNDHKEGDVVEVEEKVANSLVELKMAEITASPTNGIIDEAISKFSKGFEDVLEKAVGATVEKLGKVVESKIPAMPKDHDEEKRGGFKSAGDFLTCVMKAGIPGSGHAVDQRLKGTPSGQSAQIDVEGGYLIPEQWSNRLAEFVYGEESFIGQTDQRTTSSDNLKVNGMEETSRKDGYRHSGMLAYWMDEADLYTSATVKFKRIGLTLNKLGALCYVTEEEMADSAYALEPILTRKAGEAINFLVNLSFIDGTGAGQPTGILRSNALISVPIESNQAGEPGIQHRNIRKMYARMHTKLRAGAVWLVHPNLEERLEFISFNDDSTNQRPIYMPANMGVNSISQKGYATLYGRPVIPCEFCYDLGQKGDIIFVNWSQYLTLTKAGGGITSAQSLHVRFLYDERAFKFSFRVDGQSGWSAPIEDYRGTKTRSHIVTLAARSGEGTSSGL